ncbi:MAG: single-stranded-DNA-specific exonuclease RecJ [Planctomycetes bacterium]|nr:single-stranded-DNA-specific exonuclease RecJ [Planctomycetota bacterium]
MQVQTAPCGLLRRWLIGSAIDADTPGDLEPLVRRVLASRGLGDPDDADAFLSPSLLDLHDPSLIPDLDRAAERLLGAARGGEPIVIYGDYDVDGIAATAIVYHLLKAIAPEAEVRTYVPHRLEEGYGLNSDAIRSLAEAGARVIISVDCGITAVEPAEVARGLGVDLIITDHHTPPASMDDLPDAFAVVHPRRPDSSYPFGDLPGAGVAYKLAWRLATMSCASERVTDALRDLLVEMLAPASLGIIADVVPLVGENRIIARFGLPRVKNSTIVGLRALVEASGLAGDQIDAEAVGFRIGPRLNAAGRMGHAREAIELLTTAGPARAEEIAASLTRLNDERRRVEQRILAEAIDRAERAGMTHPDVRAIVLADENWHAGVVGIVCSRLVERFGRPTILLQRCGDLCSGSGRSIEGFSIHDAIADCAEHVESFGGHDMAAGLKLRSDQLDRFVEAFTDRANTALTAEDLISPLHVDCDADPGELSVRTIQQLDRLAPFGRANPRVRVRLSSLRVERAPNRFGSSGAHLALHAGGDGKIFRLVGWRLGHLADRIAAGDRIDAVVTPKLSFFSGRPRVEPELHDLRVVRGSGSGGEMRG